MGEDRSWMYNERKGRSVSSVWKQGLDAFLDHAFSLPDAAADGRSRCPCTKCDCRHKRKRDEMEMHLCRNGFQLGYERWTRHGEPDEPDEVVDDEYVGSSDRMSEMIHPDVVDTVDGMKPVLTWEDFRKTSTHGVSNDKRVLAEFWWRFKCRPEDRAEADAVLELKFKNIVPKMLSEEKQAVTKKLYKDGNVPPEDVDEYGNRWPTKEALISAKPKDFTTDEGWALLCEHWSTSKFRSASLKAKQNRQAGGNNIYHHGGSRSLPATRQWLALKTGVDPGIGGAWKHNHEMHPGTHDGRLCSQIVADKWAQYEEGMEKKYGPNWKTEHPDLDASVIYECVGRMPHGKLGIGDGAISIAEKEAIKTRKRSAQPYVSFKERRLETENQQLRKDNSTLENVVQVLASKQGMDFDALVQESVNNLATSESEVGFTREHANVSRNEAGQGNAGGARDYNNQAEDEDEDGGEDYDHDNNQDYGNYGDEDEDGGEDYDHDNNQNYGSYGDDDYGSKEPNLDDEYDLW